MKISKRRRFHVKALKHKITVRGKGYDKDPFITNLPKMTQDESVKKSLWNDVTNCGYTNSHSHHHNHLLWFLESLIYCVSSWITIWRVLWMSWSQIQLVSGEVYSPFKINLCILEFSPPEDYLKSGEIYVGAFYFNFSYYVPPSYVAWCWCFCQCSC